MHAKVYATSIISPFRQDALGGIRKGRNSHIDRKHKRNWDGNQTFLGLRAKNEERKERGDEEKK